MSNKELTTEEQFKRFNNFKNDERLTVLLQKYQDILNAKNNLIDSKSYIAMIESYLGGKVSCGTCPTAIQKAYSDFERVIFSQLYREFPHMLYKPDRSKLEGTRFLNGMYETVIISPFKIFNDLLSSFSNDFKGRRMNISTELYTRTTDELIDFNTKRFRYFDKTEGTIYSDYLRFKTLYEVHDVIVPEVIESVEKAPLYLTSTVLNDATIKEDFNKTEGKYKTQRKIDLTEALQLKKEGKTNEEIADTFGVTKQAVGKLFKKHLDINN
jgi:hypothetical protein